MKQNKLDNNIREKLKDRTFKPSNSAWERLSVQLDEQPIQKRKGWFFYMGIAASILLLVSLGVQIFSKTSEKVILKDKVVTSPIDTQEIDKKIDRLIHEIPVQEVIVKNTQIETKQETINGIDTEKVVSKKIDVVLLKNRKQPIALVKKESTNIISSNSSEKSEGKNFIKKELLKRDPNSNIKINGEDLLYAVTHTPKEVKQYYAKYNLSRDDVLKTIKSELKKSDLKINPNTILAEVERTIEEEDFQNNFMKSLKTKISDIATVIASRNN